MNKLCDLPRPTKILAMAGDPKSDGWERQGITIPKDVWRAMRDVAGQRGHGSMKIITTAGSALIAGMPEHVRDGLLRWITMTDWDEGPEALTPEAIYAEFLRLSRGDIGNAQVIGSASAVPPPGGKPEDKRVSPPDDDGPTHEVTRILDPAFLAKKKRGVA